MQQITPAPQQRTAAPLGSAPKTPINWHLHLYGATMSLLFGAIYLADFECLSVSNPKTCRGSICTFQRPWTFQGFDDAIFGRGQALILLKNSLLTTVGGVGFAVIFSALGG
jgi:ABC-type glycerol-3-phosphate transport system permease component